MEAWGWRVELWRESAEWKRKEVACAHETTANRASQYGDLGLVTAVVAKHAAVCTAWAILAWSVLVFREILTPSFRIAHVCFRAKPLLFEAAIANEALLWCSSGSHAEFGRQGAEWACRSRWWWKHRRFAGRVGPLEVYCSQAWKGISITDLHCLASEHLIKPTTTSSIGNHT